MERYINSFATENDIQIALENGELLKPYVAYIEDVDRIDWNSKEIVDYTTEYLTFNILSAGTINWTASNTGITKTIDYKLNDGEWVSITSNTGASAPKINVVEGDKIQFRGNNAQYATNSYSNYNSFGGSALFEPEGNIMSLIYGDDFKNKLTISSRYTFFRLFQNCVNLVSAENLILPATTLANSCYADMFAGCTSLTTAPELPATTLTDYCYQYMFGDCTSLTTVPELPATTLVKGCYGNMFQYCTSLTTAPALPATTLADSCYGSMFNGCRSLTTAPVLPATTLAISCYSGMFSNCTSLATAPELPATTLAISCYYNMFKNCTSITTAPELPATTLASSCYRDMFNSTNVLPDCSNIDFASSTVVASGGLIGLFSGTKVTDNDLERLLPKNDNGRYYLPATTLASSCYSSMFQDCTSLTTAPELPATTLAIQCYESMFRGCTSLETAPSILPAITLVKNCYRNMFQGCTSLTTAPELPATTLASSCYSSMFQDCTSLTSAPALPATTLAISCYSNMLYGCTKLNYIKCLATDISASYCTKNWVGSVASTGTFVKSLNMSEWATGINGIPNNWTVKDA